MSDFETNLFNALRASHNNGVEAAARVAELHQTRPVATPDYINACRHIAAAIRLLKSDGLEADTAEEAHV